ncbi:MAG: lipase, partial [Propionibacteriaceae bacterium]|nr:lipase [Propionibacteriaceae bacterium]
GVGLLANGIGQVVAGLRGADSLDGRIATALLGLAGVGFGGLALLWPDITMIVVAVVFGARLISAGGLQVWRALRPAGGVAADEGAPASPGRRWLRTIAAVVALALAVAAGTVSAVLREGSQVTDEFYAAPRTVPDQPGRLIRSEEFTRGVPETAVGWRILYTTTNADGSPAVASGLVVVPRSGAGDWPVIEWTHGTTGFAQQCAPSLLAEPFESGALFLLPDVIEQGWALVATDYLGLGTTGPHPYLIGRPSGQAALDAVRAARQLLEARLGDRTVAWGHSQGGGAALWAGAIADGYAPDVPLAGVAALAPAANLPELTAGLPEITGGSVFGSFVIAAYAALYPDVTW